MFLNVYAILFVFVDKWLIRLTQWCVRQCELHTSLKKMDVFSFFVITLSAFNIFFILSACGLTLCGESIFMFSIHVLVFFVVWQIESHYQNIYILSEGPALIPEMSQTNVVYRRWIRYVLILPVSCLLVSALYLLFQLIIVWFDQGYINAFNLLLMISGSFVILSIFSIEYLLCAQPMTQKEKSWCDHERNRKKYMD